MPRLTSRAALATAALGLLVAAPAATAATELVVTHDVTSATGRHVWFRPVVDGLPLVGADIYVSLDPSGREVERAGAAGAAVTGVDGGFVVPESAARQAALAASGAGPGAEVRLSRAAVPRGLRAAPVWLARVVDADAPIDAEVVIDARDGRVLGARNDVRVADGSVLVFLPNPVITLDDSTLRDRGDADAAEFGPSYFARSIQGLDGSGYLRGQWVDTTVGTPGAARAFAPDGRFRYHRDDDRFESAMSYYWLDRTQRAIQALGFGTSLAGVNREAQDVSVDSISIDNSYYSPTMDRITFGTGGVDDAEDADIILHEYGHAIQDAQVPGFGQTNEGGAMGEGFGDYWAADQTYDETTRGPTGGPNRDPACVGDWDAVSYAGGPHPCLRRVDGDKRYPEDMVDEVHADGEIWSAALWQLRQRLGGKVTDRIVLESHFSLNPNSRFADGARAIVRADGALYGGVHAGKIKRVFRQRGILG